MTRFFVDVSSNSSSPLYREISAGFTSISEKEDPVIFSGFFMNGTNSFSEIISCRSSIEFKGFLKENDAANTFLAKKRRVTGTEAKFMVAYCSDSDALGNGSYVAKCRKAVLKVKKFERFAEKTIFEGELILDKDVQQNVITVI